MLVKKMLESKPSTSVIIVVPTTNLKDQWQEYIVREKLEDSCRILILNTAAKNLYECDLLIIDELQRALSPEFIKVFSNVKHKYFLGLTATLERLDGRHQLLVEHYPIVDTITIEEALDNNWLSDYREYLVLLDVNLEEYNKANQEFYSGFEFFEKNFDQAMKSATDFKYRAYLAKTECGSTDPKVIALANKQITIAAMQFIRGLKKRKQFIYCHPKKAEVANAIIEARSDKKILTFCHTTAFASEINGETYSGQDSEKGGRAKLETFMSSKSGVLSSCKRLIEGFDCPDISVLIDLDTNSSKTRYTQRTGRLIRLQEGKIAESFTLVVKGTVEEQWYMKAIGDHQYITIDEVNLGRVLRNEEYNAKKNRETKTRDDK